MNREEIEALSGEELAAAVAERVMGWHIQQGWKVWCDADSFMKWRLPDWRPDRDISQAFEVMRAKGSAWEWEIRENGPQVRAAVYYGPAFAELAPHKTFVGIAQEADENMTRAWCVAICRASLSAADTDLGRIKFIDDAKNAERKKSFAAIAYIRAMYPEDIFPPDSDSRDAISGTWARKVCDNIRREMEIGTEEE